MKASLPHTLRQILAFIAVLAFSAQSFATHSVGMTAGGMNMDGSAAAQTQTMKSCHGDHSDTAYITPTTSKTQGPAHGQDCCDGGCSMPGCHGASALLSDLTPPLFKASPTLAFSPEAIFFSRVSHSLYRPPILP